MERGCASACRKQHTRMERPVLEVFESRRPSLELAPDVGSAD